ncbi:hypothetical protein RRG08_025857 [Elysia crispata]|uniref:Uncharacterized protein n=1 Tax=Elysia crispata TaxID=231223 RepID=A0AAE0Y376_9GAST|nr:hypothetical protein RRG08_025857 [Elysia crispata]
MHAMRGELQCYQWYKQSPGRLHDDTGLITGAGEANNRQLLLTCSHVTAHCIMSTLTPHWTHHLDQPHLTIKSVSIDQLNGHRSATDDLLNSVKYTRQQF